MVDRLKPNNDEDVRSRANKAFEALVLDTHGAFQGDVKQIRNFAEKQSRLKEQLNMLPDEVLEIMIAGPGMTNEYIDEYAEIGVRLYRDLDNFAGGYWSYNVAGENTAIGIDTELCNRNFGTEEGRGLQDPRILAELAPSAAMKLNTLTRGGYIQEFQDGTWVIMVPKSE